MGGREGILPGGGDGNLCLDGGAKAQRLSYETFAEVHDVGGAQDVFWGAEDSSWRGRQKPGCGHPSCSGFFCCLGFFLFGGPAPPWTELHGGWTLGSLRPLRSPGLAEVPQGSRPLKLFYIWGPL